MLLEEINNSNRYIINIYEIVTSFVPVYTTFVFMLFGRDLCKVALKDLRTFSPCCPLYGNVMNDNCFSDIWLLFSLVKLFSLLVLLPSLLNLNTATYQLARYLAKRLSPLNRSQYTAKSSNEFVNVIRQQVIPNFYKLVSFDVKSLFTNVPLDRTIDIILKRIYDKQEITTNIGRKEMKDLITFCTKNVPFTLNNENVPKLNSHLQFWKHYVDDTLTIVKEGSINHILQQLNSFHPNIQFTFEIESSGRIPFLDILIIRKKSKIETTVYRRSTDTGIYLN